MATFAVDDGTGFQMNYDVFPGLLPENTLFMHGNLASNRWWIPTRQVLEKKHAGLALKGALIAAEFRGCGHSSAPKSESEVDVHVFARDFIALVKDLNLAPLNLVGHSTGGLIAALMLAMEPELFKKAVLLNPVGARGVTFDNSMIAAFEQMKTDRGLVSVVMNSTIYGNDVKSDFFNSVVVEDAASAVKTVGHLVLKALDGLDVRSEIMSVRHPVLVLHGEVDNILPISDSKELARLLPNGRFEELKGCGHCANVENPSLFVERVESFLF